MKRVLFIAAVALLLIAPVGTARAVTLDMLLQTTLAKNPEIQKAKLNLERASGRRLVFRSITLPDAIIGAVGGDQGGHRAGQKANQPFGFGLGGISQPLFNAAIPASIRRGNVEVLIAQQQLNVAVVEHLHAARVAFYSGLYNRSLKQLQEEQRGRLKDIGSSQRARYESGLADRSTFVGADMQTSELSPRIEAAQRAYDAALLQDAELMGDDLGASATLPRLDGELSYHTVQLDVEAASAAALQERPDLKLARLLVRAADEDQRIIEAAYYPALNAVVSGEYIPVSGVRRESEGSPKRSDDVISSEIRAGGAYTWRVIDNGRVYGAALKQRSVKEINQLLLRKMEADVPRDLSRLKNNLQAIAANHASLSNATTAAEHTTSTVQENLAGGVVSQFEFRLAENASLQVKAGLLDLAYQQSLALAEWDRAVGRYFQFSDDPAKNMQ